MTATRVLVGLVGESPIVEEFPLGPILAQRLRAGPWPAEVQVEVEGMNWGALHVVQGLEGRRGEHARVVLVSCVQRGGPPGQLRLALWGHETLPTLALQERIYEAVTGIVSLDNLLVIGEHFKVWPEEVLMVEVEAPQSLFGDIVTVLALAREGGPAPDWPRQIGFDPDLVLLALEEAVRRCVLGRQSAYEWERRGVATMMPTEHWHIVTPAPLAH